MAGKVEPPREMSWTSGQWLLLPVIKYGRLYHTNVPPYANYTWRTHISLSLLGMIGAAFTEEGGNVDITIVRSFQLELIQLLAF